MIDIIYPIINLDKLGLMRLKYSVDSLKKTNVEFRLCVSDTSKESLKTKLDYLLDIPFDYYYEKSFNVNRSRTRNNGVKYLVKSDPFIFIDADIILPPNFLEKILKEFEGKEYLVGRIMYLPPLKSYSSNWEFLHNYNFINENIFSCGYYVYKKSIFESIQYDESYIDWGYEDLNFSLELIAKNKYNEVNSYELTGMHLYHIKNDDDYFKEECFKNWLKLCRNLRFYANKISKHTGFKRLIDVSIEKWKPHH